MSSAKLTQIGKSRYHDGSKRLKLVVSNIYQFYTNKVIIKADATQNIYFKHLTREKASYLLYNIILTKWYPVAVLILVGWLLFLSVACSWFVSDEDIANTIYYSLRSIVYIIDVIFCLSCVFASNFVIFNLVIQSFDFWFKMYNLILFLISVFVLNSSQAEYEWPILPLILQCCATFMIFFMSFILDAVAHSYKLKTIVCSIVSIYYFWRAVVVYFTYKPMLWDPFENTFGKSNHTSIDFKSLNIASLMNLIIFILKPVLGKIMRKIGQICCNANYNRTFSQPDEFVADNTKEKYQRCSGIYKKPKIYWLNKNKRMYNSQEISSTSTLTNE